MPIIIGHKGGPHNVKNNEMPFRIIPGDNSTIVKPPHSHSWAVGLIFKTLDQLDPPWDTPTTTSIKSTTYYSKRQENNTKDPEIQCGGTLIGPKHVITAEHCTHGEKNIIVVVGEHDQRIDDGEEFIPVKRKFEHPIGHHESTDYDVAILILDRVIKNKYASIALLPQPFEEFETVMVSGWGRTIFGIANSPGSYVLRTVTIDVFNKTLSMMLIRD